MEVKPKGQLLLGHFRNEFPFQLQPTISIPDYLVNTVMGNASDIGTMVTDILAGCCYPKPAMHPHNQKVAGGFTVRDNNTFINAAVPDWTWDSSSSIAGASTTAQAFRGRFYGHQTLDFVWNAATSPVTAEVKLKRILPSAPEDYRLMGFTALVSRTVYNRVPGNIFVTDCYWEVQWTVQGVLYSVKVGVGSENPPLFRKSSDNGSTWKTVCADLQAAGGGANFYGNSTPQNGQNPILVNVLLINGVMQIRLGGQGAPYVLKVGALATLISGVNVNAKCFTQFGVDIFPTAFAQTATLRSNPISLGFNPDASTPPYYYVAGSNGNTKVNSGGTIPTTNGLIQLTRVGAVTDAEQSYDLLIFNTAPVGIDFYRTPWVARVTIHVDGRWAAAASAPAAAVPQRIVESTRFDPNGLTIRQHVFFDLNNFYGQWRGQAGNIAVQLSLGYTDPPTSLFPRFTGMCGKYRFNRSGNRGAISMECCDLLKMMEDQIIFAPPLMDGWNHYYAIAYLAQLAGISLSQMAFAALVPANPFLAAPGDPAPYFLPLGDGMRPWTPRDRESSVLALSDYIRKPTGYLLYFDAQGYLRYEPWVPPSLVSPKRAFTEGPTGTNGSNLTEYFDLSLSSDLEQVRNQVLLIGINPYDPRWSIILSKREDTQSIYAAPGSEPKNYVGYKKPFVWTDARFCDPAFTSRAADTIFRLLRIPQLDVSFTCWMQPDLYVMDVIYIDDHKSGTEGVPFYVLGTDVEWSYSGGGRQHCRTTVHGRFLL